MRLFFAIEPDARARAAIGHAVADAASALGPDAAEIRWVHIDNVHLTLHFLGEVDEARARALADALRAPFDCAPFEVALDRFGVFPPAGPPRTVWLGAGKGAEETRRVYDELGRGLTALEFATESRPFTPHLTVGRVRDSSGRRVRRVRETLASVPTPAIVWLVDRETLFVSDLTGPRPRYERFANAKFEVQSSKFK